jgi:quinol monooxygenase YgiN
MSIALTADANFYYMKNIDTEKLTVTTIRVTVSPENRKEFFQTITPLIHRIKGEKGCLTYRIYEEKGDENSLILISEWQKLFNWDEHRKGDNFAVLLGSVNTLSIQAKIDFKMLSQI